jgi:hypothetical protein
MSFLSPCHQPRKARLVATFIQDVAGPIQNVRE